MTEEIEIKLEARPDDLARLRRGPALKRYAAGPSATHHLNSIYYDTPGLGLTKAGLSLRVRRQGRDYIQTIKTQGQGALGTRRGEWECPLPSAAPDLRLIADPALRQRVAAITGDAPVEPKIETEIHRTTQLLKTQSGDEIELAVDSGEIRTLTDHGIAVPVSEVELELRKGSAAGLFDIARALADEAPLIVGVESKAERGLRALEGRDVGAHKAGPIELAPDATAEEAFRATLLHCLRHIARNVAAITEARAPEGVHQARVGLRRLRAALTAFGPAFRAPALDALREKAEEIARALAGARDLDVFAAELLPPVEESVKGEPGFTPLRELLEEERAAEWDKAVALVRSDVFTSFLLNLAAAAEARVWREGADPQRLAELLEPAADLGRRALSQRLAKARKLAKHIAELTAADRHALRIALKKLRYATEFFAPLFARKAVMPFLKQLCELQDIFGALNDVEMARDIVRRLLRTAGEAPGAELRAAAGLVSGWHMGRAGLAREKAVKRWKRFTKTPVFWREAR